MALLRIKFLLLTMIPFFLSATELHTYPYLAENTWKSFANWRLTESESFEPEGVELGDIVYVDYPILSQFSSEFLPRIRNRFILISSSFNWGVSSPLPGNFNEIVNCEKVAAWFLQNVDSEGIRIQKVVPIPIGIANNNWSEHNEHLKALVYHSLNAKKHDEFSHFAILVNIYHSEISWDSAFSQPFIFKEENRLSNEEHYQDLLKSIFVILPISKDQDCYEIWESLLMGCYPVITHTSSFSLYEDLPVVILSGWDQLTEELLKSKYEEFKSKQWPREKLYAPYWFHKVYSVQRDLRKAEKIEVLQ